MLEQFSYELLSLRLIPAVLLQCKAPCCKIVPTSSAGGFRIRSDHLYLILDEIVPILDALRISLAYQEYDRRCVR
ncbi:hypothetical protein D3C78_1349280 [compost metagenome]